MNGLDTQAKRVIVGEWITEDIINRYKDLEGDDELKAILMAYCMKVREYQKELLQ